MLYSYNYGCRINIEKGSESLQVEELRKKLNYTQAEMAREIGISKRSYILKVQGESDWRLNDLIAISHLTDESITIQGGSRDYDIKITSTNH